MSTLQADERNARIGENIRRFRLLRGMTQDELATGIMSLAQISKVENGKVYIQRTQLKQFAERLSVPIERLESIDALLDELTERLQYAKEALAAGDHDKCLELIREVNSKCREFGYGKVLEEGILVEVSSLQRLKDYEAVIAFTSSALEEGLAIGKGQRIRLLCEKGYAYYEHGNVTAAYDSYSRAYDAFEGSDEEIPDFLRIKVYFDLARCHGIMKNDRSALRFAEKAEALAIEQSMYLFKLRSKYMRATFLKRLGELKIAEELYFESLKEAHDNSLLLDAAIIHNNLGLFFQDKGNYGDAVVHYERFVRLFELLKENRRLCTPLLHLSEISLQHGNVSESYEYVDKVLMLIDKIGGDTFIERAKAGRVLGSIKLSDGDFEGFVTHMEHAMAIYVDNQSVLEAYEIASKIASELDNRNDSRALSMYRKAMEYVEKSLEFGLRR